MAYHDTQQYQHLTTIAQLPPDWHPDAHTILEALHVKELPLSNVFPWVATVVLEY